MSARRFDTDARGIAEVGNRSDSALGPNVAGTGTLQRYDRWVAATPELQFIEDATFQGPYYIAGKELNNLPKELLVLRLPSLARVSTR